MADIDITQAHRLSHKKAMVAAQKMADELAQEYELECVWEENVLRFERSGVQGILEVREKEAQIQIKLGFLFSVFAAKIEEKVAAGMEKIFREKA